MTAGGRMSFVRSEISVTAVRLRLSVLRLSRCFGDITRRAVAHGHRPTERAMHRHLAGRGGCGGLPRRVPPGEWPRAAGPGALCRDAGPSLLGGALIRTRGVEIQDSESQISKLQVRPTVAAVRSGAGEGGNQVRG